MKYLYLLLILLVFSISIVSCKSYEESFPTKDSQRTWVK